MVINIFLFRGFVITDGTLKNINFPFDCGVAYWRDDLNLLVGFRVC
jgi:hypothetical protein